MVIAGAVVGVVLAYLLGSIPFAYLLLRWLKGIDIRTVGSRNVGALNTYSQLGPVGGVAVLAADAGKGAVGFFLPYWLGGPEWVSGLGAAAALAGHNWPIYLKFRGGKGAATVLGIGLALSPIYGAIAVGGAALLILATRHLVFSAFAGFIAFDIAVTVTQQGTFVLGVGTDSGNGHHGLGNDSVGGVYLHVPLGPTYTTPINSSRHCESDDGKAPCFRGRSLQQGQTPQPIDHWLG